MTDGTDRSLPSDDPLQLLAGANPVPAGRVARTSDHDAARAALFQEIIMSDPTVDRDAPSLLPPARPAHRWFWTLAVAAAVVVAVSAALVLVPRSQGNAAAALTEAARETAGASSGRVTVEAVQVGGDEAGTFTMATSYNGDDLETEITFDSPDDDGDLDRSRLRLVDGTVYSTFDDPTAPAGTEPVWYANDAADAETAIRNLALPADPTVASRGLVELVQAADDVTDSGDGRYRATVTIGQLRALDTVPAGLDLLIVDPPLGVAIPDDETIAMEIEVDASGQLSRLRAAIDDTTVGTETVPVDVTVTTTYTDLGAVGPIEAPTNTTPAPTLDLSPEQEAANAVLADLDRRRPGLCLDAISSATASDTAFEDCLRAAGEPAAADAFTTLTAGIPADGTATDTGGGNGN